MTSLKLCFIFVLQEEEMFRPNMFFLLLLPPIIFESGYSLHKVSPCQTLILHVEVLFGTYILLLVIFMKFRIIALNSIILIIREWRMQNLSLFNPECKECSLLLWTECWQGVRYCAEVFFRGWRGFLPPQSCTRADVKDAKWEGVGSEVGKVASLSS